MTVASFFAGCGGLDLGFEQAGFNVIWANEFDTRCHDTYVYNHPNTQLVKDDICNIDITSIPSCDGFIGGPPCQSWSIGGQQKGIEDDRGKLFLKYIELINLKQPKFFVIENVKGILNPKFQLVFDNFIYRLEKAGYNVKWKLLNSSHYRVPQTRERIFIIGFKKELSIEYCFPAPTSLTPISLRQAIGDITDAPIYYTDGDFRALATTTPNHVSLCTRFGIYYHKGNRRRGWEMPSYTINASSEFIPLHPSSPKMMFLGHEHWEFQKDMMNMYRRLSVRECARIQTFPDMFIFDCKDIKDAYRMVGNAVPPRLAYEIAKSIMDAMCRITSHVGQERKTDIQDNTILVGYYKTNKHRNLILANKLYYIRSDGRHGSIFKEDCGIAPKFLLLYHKDKLELFELDGEEPVMSTSSFLKSLGFLPSGQKYLCFRLKSDIDLSSSIFNEDVKHITHDTRQYTPYFTTLNR